MAHSKNNQKFLAPHIDSFNYFLNDYLKMLPKYFRPVTWVTTENPVKITLLSVSAGKPTKIGDFDDCNVYPSECRLSLGSYSAKIDVKIELVYGSNPPIQHSFQLDGLPIMIMSSHCNLTHVPPPGLPALNEEETERGGYFVVNGKERIIRLLMAQRRNFFLSLSRKSFKNHGGEFSQFAVSVRSVREDCHSATLYAHYLTTKDVKLRFSLRRRSCLVPAVLVLKCLCDVSDKRIFLALAGDAGEKDAAMFGQTVDVMLRRSGLLRLNGRKESLAYLGKVIKSGLMVMGEKSDFQAGRAVVDDYIFVHCYNDRQKYEFLISMVKRVLSLANGTIKADNNDGLNFLEALLPGHLYSAIFKETLTSVLLKAAKMIDLKKKTDFSGSAKTPPLFDIFRDSGLIKRHFEAFLQTGNLNMRSGLDMPQISGYTISTERINYCRFISHFRSIHRGQYFLNIRTTAVRKLLPECWGFICPVHTPDGSLCGLLNHLTSSCGITTDSCSKATFKTLNKLIKSILTEISAPAGKTPIPIWLNGIKIGAFSLDRAETKLFIKKLRFCKLGSLPKPFGKVGKEIKKILKTIEIVPVLPDNVAGGYFYGIYICSEQGRFIRPVMNNEMNKIEKIGSFEQLFLDISVPGDNRRSKNPYSELSEICTLSSLAALTPFSDFNQSPRNMYQCQMAKQSMGLPFYNFSGRGDNKTYILNSLQKPLVQNDAYSEFGYDHYPMGFNAIVCVIAYTGYDMEDAVIINKSSYERGLAHGSIIATEFHELIEEGRGSTKKSAGQQRKILCNPIVQSNEKTAQSLDYDGLPCIGQRMAFDSDLLCLRSADEALPRVVKSKTKETYSVKDIVIVGEQQMDRVAIKKEFSRNPRIGDKFSSRHGQKGTLSQLWPLSDMPFSSDGIVPDILINPHAFPSRMTIGMFIESIAGKAGALNGEGQNGTPFRKYPDKNTAVDHFGEELKKHGFDYYGNEEMYSALSGKKIDAEIFMGVVYYQRLRHMVLDKSQVRSSGPVNKLTKQPVKGRKLRGGIRFGEMERDSLIAHGCAFLLKDRMLNCSDHHIAVACKTCRSIISTQTRKVDQRIMVKNAKTLQYYFCRTCGSDENVAAIEIPYSLVYLLNELASVNIKMDFDIG